MLTLLLVSFSADLKTIAIVILLSILFGVFLTMRNYRGGGAYVEDKSFDSSLILLLLALIAGIILYSFYSSSISGRNTHEQPFQSESLEDLPNEVGETFIYNVPKLEKEVDLTSSDALNITKRIN